MVNLNKNEQNSARVRSTRLLGGGRRLSLREQRRHSRVALLPRLDFRRHGAVDILGGAAARDAPLLFAGGAARHTTDRATPKPPPPVQKKSTPDRQTSRRRRLAASSAPPLVRLVRAFERGEPRIVQRRALAGRGDESASRLKLKRRGGGRAAALAAAGGGDRGGRTAHARGRIAEHAWSSASRSPAMLRIALRVELHDGRVTAHALLGRLRLGEKEKRGMRI